ncbi:MAG TPA: IPT/TIG domain-containing protein [Solirubrobacteraceae bacterium]|nr:IPT/TIG domain-containing protein [Solirubrobacteraceae bacterium]
MAIAAESAVASTSQVTSWGANLNGQLGNGTTSNRHIPAPVTGLSGPVTSVAAGIDTGLALLNNGAVEEWGGGAARGNEDSLPVPVSGLSGVTAITALGEGGGLALLTDGTVMQWAKHGAPVVVSGLSGATAVAGGLGFALALLSNGTVVAWGTNEWGQLGDGTTESSATPVAVSGLSGVRSISAGYFHSLAVLNSGQVMAWGNNFDGQLGDGEMGEGTYEDTNSDVPVAVCAIGTEGPCPSGPYLSEVTAVSATNATDSLALLANGTAVAWGQNDAGELGDGINIIGSDVPVAVEDLSDVTAIATGGSHSLAVLRNGTVMAWGWNASGMLGDGSSTGPEKCDVEQGDGGFPCSRIPVAVSKLTGVVGVAAGGGDSFAYKVPGPSVTNMAPSTGPATGHTSVTVTGTGFALGKTATLFKFGTAKATSVDCTSTTTCSLVTPAHAAGIVDVTATVNKVTSAKNPPGDEFTYS